MFVLQKYASSCECSLNDVEVIGTFDPADALCSVTGLCVVGARWDTDKSCMQPHDDMTSQLPQVYVTAQRKQLHASNSSHVMLPVLDCVPSAVGVGTALFNLQVHQKSLQPVGAAFVPAVFLDMHSS